MILVLISSSHGTAAADRSGPVQFAPAGGRVVKHFSTEMDDTELLIELVRNHIHLYDKRHVDYKDMAKKAESWKEIAETLNQTSEAVKFKWKNLRDSYIKYLKFLNGIPGSCKKFQNWPWAGHLEFLQDTISLRLTISEVLHPSVSIHCDGNYNDDSVPDESQMLPPKKKLKDSKEVRGSVDKIINSYLRNEQENQILKNLDHIDNLFLSYADTFKKFSPRTQAVIKMELAQMFGKAELRELNDPNPPVPAPK